MFPVLRRKVAAELGTDTRPLPDPRGFPIRPN